MILKLRQVGEPVLRQKSHPLPLEEIGNQYVRDLIESMRQTMHDAPGVGLAAPQIGIPLQLVVIEDPPEAIEKLSSEQAAERERRPVPFQVLINPALTIPDRTALDHTAAEFRGCLILRNEIDHLHGILYIDRMNTRMFASMEYHLRIWKDKLIARVKQALSGKGPNTSNL